MNNIWIDIVGWVGNVGFIVGAIALAKKSISGFYWQILGNAMYLIQAAILSISSLIVLSIILIGINVLGIINWRKNVSNQFKGFKAKELANNQLKRIRAGLQRVSKGIFRY